MSDIQTVQYSLTLSLVPERSIFAIRVIVASMPGRFSVHCLLESRFPEKSTAAHVASLTICCQQRTQHSKILTKFGGVPKPCRHLKSKFDTKQKSLDISQPIIYFKFKDSSTVLWNRSYDKALF